MKISQYLVVNLKQLAIENKNYWLLFVVLVIMATSYFWYQSTNNSQVYYLANVDDASWIGDNSAFDVNAKPYKQRQKYFKKNFSVSKPINNAILNVKAFKYFRVFIDEHLIHESTPGKANWKDLHEIELGTLNPGEHELVIAVMNYDGPTAVLAYSEKLHVKTDGLWLVNTGEDDWGAVLLMNKPKVTSISLKFPPAYKEIVNTIPVGVFIFLLVIAISKYRVVEKLHLNIEKLRWILLSSWVVLMVDSVAVTKPMGFDMMHHLEYIQFILIEGRLPLATDGLQMFQSPLFYVLGAIFVKLTSLVFDLKTSFHLLKLIPLLCGIAMVEICYRCARLSFPGRNDLQCVTLFVGALIPMNLYMSQYISNEPLLGLLSAICILMMLTWFRNRKYAVLPRQQITLGILLGLALLTKATAFILIAVTLVSVAFILLNAGCTRKTILISLFRILFVILIVAGWYYIRNWLLLGKPFVGGWDAGRGITWWQEPGYRNFSNFITFGQALIYPVYAATHSFWDALYSTLWADGLLGSQSTFETKPPWNYRYILATIWLSLIPSIGLITALLFPMRSKYFDVKTNNITFFCGSIVVVYILAICYLYFHLPIYSTAKASYTLGLLPCYAVLTAVGLSRFMDNKFTRPIIASLLIWWGISSYIGYFSLGAAT